MEGEYDKESFFSAYDDLLHDLEAETPGISKRVEAPIPRLAAKYHFIFSFLML